MDAGGVEVLNKSYFQSFLIVVSSLVFPCAVMEYSTPLFTYVQVWIFPFGAFFQEFGIGNYPTSSQFVMLFSQSYLILFSIIELVTSVAIGLILATIVVTLQESTDIIKKIYVFTILLLLITIQVALAIDVVTLFALGGSLLWANYIFPLPIPLLIAILLLKHKGFRFMRESYFQGFLIFISSLMLPFAVVGFETNSQNWLFPFGVYQLSFSEHLVRSGFLMPFYRENWFPYFIIFAVVWGAIGLIFAAEVIKLWGGKKFTKKAFSISIILLTLEIVGPIVAVLLMYGWTLAYISYIIPLPIPYLVAILLLRRRGVTLMSVKKLRRS